MIEEKKEYTLSYKDSHATKEQLFKTILAWFEKHECYSGESIMQCDAPQITAATLLADIADDVLSFKCDWKDDF